MRPLRLLLALSSSVIAITLLLYMSIGRDERTTASHHTAADHSGNTFSAYFSFHAPSSLFPPSAIISLTDDNSTFFLARPAAFGPLLPSRGLSGPLWIGSGFGADTLGRGGVTGSAEGELGCSDVPGWTGELKTGTNIGELGSRRKQVQSNAEGQDKEPEPAASKRRRSPKEKEDIEEHEEKPESPTKADGTDDHLHHGLQNTENGSGKKTSEHADIQSLQEGAEIAGKVVLLSRGGCGFLEKVKWAQRRGATALIVGDDTPGGPLVNMYARGDTSNITIPAIFTSHTTAHLLSSLIPPESLQEHISIEEAIKTGQDPAKTKSKGTLTGQQEGGPTFTRTSATSTSTALTGNKITTAQKSKATHKVEMVDNPGWLRRFFGWMRGSSKAKSGSVHDSQRPPNSGNIDWVLVQDFDDDALITSVVKGQAQPTKKVKATSSRSHGGDDFIIGVHDWRDPDMIPTETAKAHSQKTSAKTKPKGPAATAGMPQGGNAVPASGEYHPGENGDSSSKDAKSTADSVKDEDDKGWLERLRGGSDVPSTTGDKSEPDDKKDPKDGGSHETPKDPNHHEGLWVTLSPTTMSTSPFFDTLLVLVVSPLVTLTIVYALLLLRSRWRRRQWRAPKHVVERLPVRTYHTLSSTESTTTATPLPTPPINSSDTTPLLNPSSRLSTRSRPRSRTTSEVPPATTSSSLSDSSSTTAESEKREAGLASWRRRYGGRQKECVVCLEEYVDGVSRVMSLPCGHEFHAECM